MDIGALSEENFDAVDWINRTLKNSEEQQSKEAVVSSLVAKLQLYVQQVNSALEDTSQQVLASMPRIMNDAQSLQSEARQLKMKMSEIQKDIFHVHKETNACMANLERLDSMKNKLQAAKEGLQESDGWGKLVAELEDFFEQNDVKHACEKLEALQKSLVAQVGLPGQSERETQIEGFKNRLEALASTAVVQCFTTQATFSGDIEQSRCYVKIFSSIGRSRQLLQYYLTVQKRIVQQQWTEKVELNQNFSSTAFLREFYDYLFQYYQKQLKWCINVFGASQSHDPIIVVIESLLSFEPSREKIVISCLKRNDDKLTTLQDISKANVYFGRLFIDSFNGYDQIDMELLKTFSSAVFDYFNTFIGQTASFEQQWLASRLSELVLVHSTAAESVRAIGNAMSKIFGWMNETLKRCERITQNCGLSAIVTVLNEFLKSVLDKFKKAQQQLHACHGAEHDWNLLQTCISLLEHIGDFRLKLINFEKKMVQIIQEKKKEIDDAGETITYQCSSYKLSSNSELNDFNKLFDKSQKPLGIFFSIFDAITPTCEYIHDTILAAIFMPIENQLKGAHFESNENIELTGNGLPDYSFAPQEFITVIGQYLLTLPQNLEPLLLTPSQQLKSALELCDERYGRVGTVHEASADILLSLVTEECCALYEEVIGKICEFNAYGAKQLACDIEYLGEVLKELGHSLSTNLQQIVILLRTPAEKHHTLCTGFDHQLNARIRKIISKDF